MSTEGHMDKLQERAKDARTLKELKAVVLDLCEHVKPLSTDIFYRKMAGDQLDHLFKTMINDMNTYTRMRFEQQLSAFKGDCENLAEWMTGSLEKVTGDNEPGGVVAEIWTRILVGTEIQDIMDNGGEQHIIDMFKAIGKYYYEKKGK